MMTRLAVFLAIAVTGTLQAAEIPLYPTGPSEDAAFLRFVNAGDSVLELNASGTDARLRIEPAAPASDFLTVPAGKPIKGELRMSGQGQSLDVSVEPGEFATVVGIPREDGLDLVTLREQPDDFNALKASLAFYSLDENCADAGLQAAGRNVDIFKGVARGSLQRRSINPVKLAVQLSCAGAPAGEPLDLGELAAGQRYTVLLVPSTKGPRLLEALDTLAN